MQFPYQDEPLTGTPPPSLLISDKVRWRPLVPVTIIGAAGSLFFPRALLDIGSDDTLFPTPVAQAIGATFHPDTGHGHRWRGQRYSLRFADIELELYDGMHTWRWPAVIGFSAAQIRYPILGVCGCLQFFDACFHGKDRIVDLEINPSCPGITT